MKVTKVSIDEVTEKGIWRELRFFRIAEKYDRKWCLGIRGVEPYLDARGVDALAEICGSDGIQRVIPLQIKGTYRIDKFHHKQHLDHWYYRVPLIVVADGMPDEAVVAQLDANLGVVRRRKFDYTEYFALIEQIVVGRSVVTKIEQRNEYRAALELFTREVVRSMQVGNTDA